MHELEGMFVNAAYNQLNTHGRKSSKFSQYKNLDFDTNVDTKFSITILDTKTKLDTEIIQIPNSIPNRSET